MGDGHRQDQHQHRADRIGEPVFQILDELAAGIERDLTGVNQYPPEHPRIEHQPADQLVEEFFQRSQQSYEVHDRRG
ncbi:hypothetical protein D3C73_1324260 [compost metagenome]